MVIDLLQGYQRPNLTSLFPPPTKSTAATEITTEMEELNTTTPLPYSNRAPPRDEEEYQRQFFLLKIFVLGGIGFVFLILAVIFWSYYMYLWRTWDSNKRPDAGPLEEQYAEILDGAEFLNYDGSDVANNLIESRRKSVSFAVCTPVKEEKGPDGESRLSFDITVRSVPIRGNDKGRGSIGSRYWYQYFVVQL